MVRVEASGLGGRRFYSRREQVTAFEGGDGWRAGNIQLLYAGWGLVMSTIPKRKYKRSDIEANYRNETKTF